MACDRIVSYWHYVLDTATDAMTAVTNRFNEGDNCFIVVLFIIVLVIFGFGFGIGWFTKDLV
jgi:hypothetical protein